MYNLAWQSMHSRFIGYPSFEVHGAMGNFYSQQIPSLGLHSVILWVRLAVGVRWYGFEMVSTKVQLGLP